MHARRLVLLLVTLASLLVVPAQVLAEPAPSQAHATVLFVGGYGSTLASATLAFAPLRAALTAHDPSTSFAQYSYQGWDAQACAPRDYYGADTGQDFDVSERGLLETIYSLRTHCGGSGRIVVIGHSLGGLIAFHALADNPMSEVSDIVTIDSPLGGAPESAVAACVDSGLCVDGPVAGYLANLFNAWNQTAAENASRVAQLQSAGIHVTAWGSQGDCLYAPSVCVPLARYLFGNIDARATQWLGVDHAMRRDAAPLSSLARVLNSHQALLSSAATDIVGELFG